MKTDPKFNGEHIISRHAIHVFPLDDNVTYVHERYVCITQVFMPLAHTEQQAWSFNIKLAKNLLSRRPQKSSPDLA